MYVCGLSLSTVLILQLVLHIEFPYITVYFSSPPPPKKKKILLYSSVENEQTIIFRISQSRRLTVSIRFLRRSDFTTRIIYERCMFYFPDNTFIK